MKILNFWVTDGPTGYSMTHLRKFEPPKNKKIKMPTDANK